MLNLHFMQLILRAVISCCFSHKHTDCSLCMLPSQMVVQRDCLYGCYIIYDLCFYVTFSLLNSDDEITELEVKHGCAL